MNSLSYLTKKKFFKVSEEISGAHWKYLDSRWDYHSKALDALKLVKISRASEVLEMGTMGVQLLEGSHTIDYMDNWNYEGKNPTYIHDAKMTPWPIEDKQYKCFVALRVFQHLQPYQKEAFLEAKRIANSIILVVPEESNDFVSLTKPKGIRLEDLKEWNDGLEPNLIEDTRMGTLYFFEF